MRNLLVAAFALCSPIAVLGQSVISAHSGVLHVSEGAVFLDGKEVNQKYGTFPDIKENSKLSTEAGRAEILLTPGVFLRVGDQSAVRMVTNRLIDTRVEFLGGKVIVESDSPMKDNAVTIVYKDFQVHVRKAGVFEMQTSPEELKVYHGEAEVEANGETTVVRAGRLLPFGRALVSEKFDAKDGDDLARWSMQRSQNLAVANVSAAKSLRDSGSTWGGSGGWYYNPFYSMYTYVPGMGTYWSPYGYGFWSPYTVYSVYRPAIAYGGGGRGVSTAHVGDQTSNGFGRASANNSLGNMASSSSSTGFGRASGAGSSGASSGMGAGSAGGGGFSGGGASGGGRGGHR